MDEFAQSRDDIDLFDDDIIPVDPPEEDAEVETVAKQVQDISLKSAPKGPSGGNSYQRSSDSRGDRGRGRGGRGRGSDRTNTRPQSSSLSQSKHAPPPPQASGGPTAASPPPLTPPPGDSKLSESEVVPAPTASPGSEEQTEPPPAPPTEPSTPARPPAVRGDRTATGGIKKPKLTEDELTAKLAAAKTRSESRSAAHARAEADAAKFAERERAAAEKRIKDVANRKVMEGEREKNRARKMAVMGGREWDAEKNEEDFKAAARGRGRGQYTRGAHGGVRTNVGESPDDDLRQYQWKDDAGSRGQGRRRGRGSERGVPRGRADHRSGAARQPDMAQDSEFPSLPVNPKSKESDPTERGPELKKSSSEVMSPAAGTGSWADQVEVSEAAKPKPG